MFDYLRRKTLENKILLVLGCAALCAGTGFAATNTQTISAITSQAGIKTTDANFTGATYSMSGSGDKDALAVNNITINYNGSAADGLSTQSAISMQDNTLTISGGEMGFAGDNMAARVKLNNASGGNAADLSGFNFSLQNNTLTLRAKVGSSSGEENGNLYGALFAAVNSGVGNTDVTGNAIVVDTAAQISGYTPSLTGGAMSMSSTSVDLVSSGVVASNTVTVNASSANKFNSSITGGTLTVGISEESTHKNYNITADVNGNQVNLASGKFSGTITGGRATVSTGAEYNTVTFGGDVQNNQVNISGGTYEESTFIGGNALISGSGLGAGSNPSISVHDNSITVTGGKFTDTIFVGGMTAKKAFNTQDITGSITGNTVEISGTPTFNGSLYIFGGYTPGDNTISGNTLSLKTGGIVAYGVDYFDTYKFDVSAANAGDTYLSVRRGNGHNNSLFAQYENYVKNSAIDLSGVTFSWKDTSLPEDGRPSSLGVGQSITLLTETSGLGLKGTIANDGEELFTTVGGNDYYYKVLQIGNSVELLHSGINAGGDWTADVSLTAGANAGEDVFMHVDSGTITAGSISATSTGAAAATLTAQTLDVTAQDTALTLNGTTGDKVNFTTINVANHNLTKSGSGFYGFTTMNITGTGAVNSVDAMGGTASTVSLASAAHFDTVNIGSGSTLNVTGAAYTFDNFNVYGTGTLSGDLNAANKNVNFFLADTTAAGDTVLNVTGTANVTDSVIKVGINGASSPLNKDDQVVLLQAGTLTGTPASMTGVGMTGLLAYDFDLSIVGSQLVATVTKAGLTQESKAFLEGRAASIGLVGQGADFLAETGITSASNAAWNQGGLAMFTAFGGGKSRLESGSHVDMRAGNALVGLSREVSIFKADFVVASYAEYGKGRYDSYNDFSFGSVKGSGDTEYGGIGALARWYGQDGSYVEGSLHSGVTSTDFKGAVFFADQYAKYDFKSWYYGGHFGVGHRWNLFEDVEDFDEEDAIQIDGSVKYFLNHQEAKDVTLSTGDSIRFHDANSSRLRVGAKANFFASRVWRPYIGAAYDHEFAGEAKASAYHTRIDAPSLGGDTWTGEIGLSFVKKGFTAGIGAEGFTGTRRGWSGNVNVGFVF